MSKICNEPSGAGRRHVIQSSSFRMAMAFTGLIFVVMVAATLASYLMSKYELEDLVRDEITDRLRIAKAAYRQGKIPALITHIENRRSEFKYSGKFYLLRSDDGRALAGNIESLPKVSGWNKLQAKDVIAVSPMLEDTQSFIVFSARLGQNTLYLGQADFAVEDMREVILIVLLWTLAGAVVLTFAGGWFAGLKTEQRILAIQSTLDDVATGAVEARVPHVQGDSDDLGRVAASINATLERLAGLIESQRQISADIAHDLKTPITHLHQLLEVAGDVNTESEVRAQALASAVAESTIITDTFDALLHIAQLEGSDRHLRFSLFDLAETGRALFEMYHPVAEDAGHDLTFDVTSSSPIKINGDRELITRLLANLLDNAIIHCPTPTKVGLTISRKPGEVVIVVTDSGPGIPAGERKAVFQRFYRLDESREQPGHGLGLSLVAAIVDLHGANVELADNQPGLKVKVRLPIAPA